MKLVFLRMVLLAVGRSREGAWIEIARTLEGKSANSVAPARERGLKSSSRRISRPTARRRSREGAWIEIKDVSYEENLIKSLPRGSVD